MSRLSQCQNVFRVTKQGATDGTTSDVRVAKRNRQVISCSICRTRKLKCDRQIPCSACAKRGDGALCSYTRNDQNGGHNAGSKDSEAQKRLQKLEEMVTNMMQTAHGSFDNGDRETYPQNGTVDERLDSLSVNGSTEASESSLPGHLELNGSETNYLGATHWATILDSIRDIQGILEIKAEEAPANVHSQAPDILLDTTEPLTLATILNSLPPRIVVDGLLSAYFNAKYYRNPMIHSGKFLREYESFWQNPSSVSFLWISILFSVLHIGSRISQAADRGPLYSADLPRSTNAPAKPSFLVRAGQALITGGYDKARPYSVEAFLLYAFCKFSENKNQDTTAWTLMGVSVRLAMRMGYHRDPRHFPTISPFEGEMRRRAFMMAETFDLLLSFQAGLPAIIHEDEYDTEPPSNLFDTDFDEDNEALPPPRPPTDSTPMLYYRFKGQMAKMLRRVTRHALSFKKPSYADTMKLDNELHQMYKEVPPSLRMRPLSSSITDEPHMILWRLNIDLLYQRSLCVLHRDYLSHNRFDESFEYARTTCTKAALEILKHQADLQFACQPGGQFRNDQWMLSNLNLHDFLIAAMIICLDLYESRKDPDCTFPEYREAPARKIEALRTSYEIWTSQWECCRDARRASRILAVMLSKLQKPKLPFSPIDSSHQLSPQASMNGGNLMDTLPDFSRVPPLGTDDINLPNHEANANFQVPLEDNPAEPLDSIFTDPDNIGWGLVDQYLQDRSDLTDAPLDLELFGDIGTVAVD